MNRVRPSWAGVLLSAVSGLWAATILLEFIAAQPSLGAPDVDWQSEYDSGEMAFASIPALFTLLLASLAAALVLVVVAVRKAHLTTVGLAFLVPYVGLLVWIWTGPGAPGSDWEFWARFAGWFLCAILGIVAGVGLRPRRQRVVVTHEHRAASHP